MKRILITLLIATLCIGTAHANDPKKSYWEQRKYQKMFCVIAGIPINQCNRKPKK